MIFELAQDFHDCVAAMPREHPKHRMLELLEEAVRRDIHFIARHPTTLFQCMWNTCWWYDCPKAEKHYLEPEDGWPEAPPWEQPGPKLCELLADWRDKKEMTRPKFLWIRSLRPPSQPLAAGIWRSFNGHKDTVNCIAYSPDGRRIVTCAADRTIRVWHAYTGAELACIHGHTGEVTCVCFSPDGQRILSAAEDGTARVWDAESGSELLRLTGGEYFVSCALFAESGDAIVTAHYDPYFRSIRIWNANTGEQRTCLCHEADLYAAGYLAVSPDGDLVASCHCRSGEVKLWDCRHAVEVRCFQGHAAAVTSVSFSRDGRFIVSGAMDGSIKMWNQSNGEQVKGLHCQGLIVRVVGCSPDGRLVAAGLQDGTVCIWNTADCTEFEIHGYDHYPDGSTESRHGTVVFSPDGRRVALTGRDYSVVEWQVERPSPLPRRREPSDLVRGVSFSSDDRYLSVSLSGRFLDKPGEVWDVRLGIPCGNRAGFMDAEWKVPHLRNRRLVTFNHDKLDIRHIVYRSDLTEWGERPDVLFAAALDTEIVIESVIESMKKGEAVAWFPAVAEKLQASLEDLTLIGFWRSELHILFIEGISENHS